MEGREERKGRFCWQVRCGLVRVGTRVAGWRARGRRVRRDAIKSVR